jgi:NAD(P) transhydrogenase subunit beta
MKTSLITIAYIAASALFILSLGGLSRQETARRGNVYGIVGMLIALVATAAAMNTGGLPLLGAALAPGLIIGAIVASRVQMTSMPELVAILHSFVGLAAVLVGFATYLGPHGNMTAAEKNLHTAEVFIGVCIGSITFTGSVIAFLKLRGSISGKPLMLPARHMINIIMLLVTIGLGVAFFMSPDAQTGQWPLLIATVLTGILGIHFIMAIGGADMPVVVSMLNSYSGWAASAAGFMLSNDLLIITGALVGSSGAILSYIMCRGMNRSFISVMLGGFGTEGGAPAAAGSAPAGEVKSIDAESTASMLQQAKKVIIVPGYGLAVAQAQHSLAEVVKILKEGGTEVKFAIHPVAGRLPGHMNVLLAEANIPYDIVFEMDEINNEFPGTDVAWVIGANDIVNPSALDDPASPIAGMPVLHVWESRDVVVMKRSMASGYAGVDNPLFYKENTLMLFGDAKKVVDEILTAMRA